MQVVFEAVSFANTPAELEINNIGAVVSSPLWYNSWPCFDSSSSSSEAWAETAMRMEVAGKEGNLQEVSGSGMRGEIAHLHILGHALTKGCHGKLLCEMEWAASSVSMISHRSSGRNAHEVRTSLARSKPQHEESGYTYR